MIFLSISLALSILLNILFVWYIRRLIKQFLFFSENIEDLNGSLNIFDDHLKNVHDLEVFYGDETLGSLIRHSKAVVEKIKDFHDTFLVETVEGEDEVVDEDKGDEGEDENRW